MNLMQFFLHLPGGWRGEQPFSGPLWRLWDSSLHNCPWRTAHLLSQLCCWRCDRKTHVFLTENQKATKLNPKHELSGIKDGEGISVNWYKWIKCSSTCKSLEEKTAAIWSNSYMPAYYLLSISETVIKDIKMSTKY